MASITEHCRLFYNLCLAELQEVYEKTGKRVSKFAQMKKVKEYKKGLGLGRVHSHCLQGAVADLHKAMDAFFRRLRSGEKPGYPRFKGVHRFDSFGFKELGNGFRLDGRRLKITGVGRVAVRWHRELDGEIKTLRVKRKNGKWYAFFACETTPEPLPPKDNEVGIDLGIASLATLSTGEKVENPRWYKKASGKLKRLQQSVSRKKKGGRNRKKAVHKLARFAEHVANQRKDFIEKLTYRLVRDYGKIAVEALSVARMARDGKRKRLSRGILDAGWGYFTERLASKAANAGREFVKVNPAYTTQDCCECGKRRELTLKERWYSCECGNSRDRDENAALNVLRAGRALWESSPSFGGFSREAAGF